MYVWIELVKSMNKDKIRILIAATLVLSIWATTELLVPIYKANRDASMIMVVGDQSNTSVVSNGATNGVKSSSKHKSRSTSDNPYDLAGDAAKASGSYNTGGSASGSGASDLASNGVSASRKLAAQNAGELSGSLTSSSSSYRGGRSSSNNGSYNSFSGLMAKNTTVTNNSNPSILSHPQAAPTGDIDGGDPGGDPTGNPIPIPDAVLFSITLAFLYFIIKSRYKK